MLCTNCIYVDEGELKISTNKLYTTKVGTCSLLLFSYKNKNFLAHIDPIKNNSDEIVDGIHKECLKIIENKKSSLKCFVAREALEINLD